MSSKSKEPDPSRRQLGVEPRQLPEQHETAGDPFEQLNAASVGSDDSHERSMIRPRDLPERDPQGELTSQQWETMREAVRLMEEEGQSHEEAAKQLHIEPLQLRRWENAYHEYLQSDLNDGDFHDTNAQLVEVPENSKERYHDNWEQVLEKQTQRRIKVSETKLKLMAHPMTRWMFRNEHGDLDWGTITGITVIVLSVVTTIGYMNRSQQDPIATEEDNVWIANELTSVEHDGMKAANVVIAFHKTTSWEDKIQYVLAPEKVRGLMETWYKDNPDQVTFDRLDFVHDQEAEHDGRNFLLLALQLGKKGQSAAYGQPSFMAVERLNDGSYLIDWEVSSGYQEMPLSTFRDQRLTVAKEFRVTVELTDYYNFQFTEDKYVAFSATTIKADEEPLYVYGRRDDAKVAAIESTLKEVRDSMGMIVTLRYPENSKANNQVHLEEVISEAWFRDYASN